jgi:hypothetical protein
MDNPIYHKNYTLLKARWPSIINYIESLDEQINVDLLKIHHKNL